MFDVAVIGGGVVGGLVLRELTKYNLYQDKHTPNCQMSKFCIFFDNKNED